MRILGLDFRPTCFACPEQYDVYDDHGNQVGYVRLRRGHIEAQYPYCGGATVYECDFVDCNDGIFSNDTDRQLHLSQIARILYAHINGLESSLRED